MKKTKNLLPSFEQYMETLIEAHSLCERIECRRCPFLTTDCLFTELASYHKTLKNTLKAKAAKLDEEDRYRQTIIYF